MNLEENMVIGKMVIKDSDGTIVRTSIYPYGATILSWSEVNFDDKNAETDIVLEVTSSAGKNIFRTFQKRIQLIKGQTVEFEESIIVS